MLVAFVIHFSESPNRRDIAGGIARAALIFFLFWFTVVAGGIGAALALLELVFRKKMFVTKVALVTNIILVVVPLASLGVLEYRRHRNDRLIQQLPDNRLLNLLSRDPFDRQAALEALGEGAKVNGTDGRLLAHMSRVPGTPKQAFAFLIEHGADVNAVDPWEGTALHAAIDGGSLANVEALLDNGADPNRKRPHNGLTPLHEAVWMARLEMIEILLRHEGDPMIRTHSGETALDLAIRRSRSDPRYPIDRVRRLLERE